jgi:hypothetical protein
LLFLNPEPKGKKGKSEKGKTILKFSITAATVLALVSSSSAAVYMTLDLFDRENWHGGNARHFPISPSTDADLPYSFCGGVDYKVYMDRTKGGTMRVKSLDFNYGQLDPGVRCCLWAYRKKKCAGRSSKDVMELGCGKPNPGLGKHTGGTWYQLVLSSPVWEKKRGWKKAESFQIQCTKKGALPPKPPAVTKKTQKEPTSPSYYDNCYFPSGCAKRWIPGNGCKKYCENQKSDDEVRGYKKGDLTVNFETNEGCSTGKGLFSLREDRCCCAPKENLSR